MTVIVFFNVLTAVIITEVVFWRDTAQKTFILFSTETDETQCLHALVFNKATNALHHSDFMGTSSGMTDVCAISNRATVQINHVSMLVDLFIPSEGTETFNHLYNI